MAYGLPQTYPVFATHIYQSILIYVFKVNFLAFILLKCFLSSAYRFLVQVQPRADELGTPSSTQPGFELMTPRS